MESNDRSKIYKEQTDDLYRAIGKFSVTFEMVVFAMRQGITFFLGSGGLKNQQLSNIVLAGLTAQPMKNIFLAMIPEIVNLNEKENKIVKNILKRTQDLIENRNDIIHSTWFVGAAHEQDMDFSEVSGHKLKAGSNGAGVKNFKHTSGNFDALSLECEKVAKLIQRLYSVIVFGNSIEKNFIIDANGQVKEPSEKEQ